jgi:hypothetical protein
MSSLRVSIVSSRADVLLSSRPWWHRFRQAPQQAAATGPVSEDAASADGLLDTLLSTLNQTLTAAMGADAAQAALAAIASSEPEARAETRPWLTERLRSFRNLSTANAAVAGGHIRDAQPFLGKR